MFHGGLPDEIFDTIMTQRTESNLNQNRQVKITRPQFIHEMPARYVNGANVSIKLLFFIEILYRANCNKF